MLRAQVAAHAGPPVELPAPLGQLVSMVIALQLVQTDAARVDIALLGMPLYLSRDGRAVAPLGSQTVDGGPDVPIPDQPPTEPAAPRRMTHPSKASVDRHGIEGYVQRNFREHGHHDRMRFGP
eukprot:10785298-Alexandrium_andersonii.AAC.1